MWLYGRLVLSTYSSKITRLTKEQFSRCLMAPSADSTYLDWLFGRQLSERHRSPCFARFKTIIARRIEQDTGSKHFLPQPSSLAGGKAVAARARGRL